MTVVEDELATKLIALTEVNLLELPSFALTVILFPFELSTEQVNCELPTLDAGWKSNDKVYVFPLVVDIVCEMTEELDPELPST